MDSFKASNREDFRDSVQRSFTATDADTVLKAHDCAAERLGTDITEHVRVADILLRHYADHVVITTALLVPLRRHGCIELNEIRSLFGEVPASLVEKALSKEALRSDSEAHCKEDLQCFLESISGDIRAVILRVGLRLAELERVAGQSSNDHHDVAQETLELYVPLADRMGMGALRTRLEDVCFQILEPSAYEELARNVEPIRAEDEVCLKLLKHDVKRLLEKNGVKGTVYGRTKGLYSLYRKMCCLECSLQDIMDRIGLRVIVSSVEECYAVLRLLHTHFRPIPGTFDDYIGFPKENGYQSLHTCVYPARDMSQKPVEFQIRTQSMHREAQFGIAAHWLYKDEEEARLKGERQLQWLRSLPTQREKAASHADFVECLRLQSFEERPLIFSKAGWQVQIPEDVTVEESTSQTKEMAGHAAPLADGTG